MSEKTEEKLEITMAIIISFSVFLGLFIFGWQIYQWLRFGYWIKLPLSNGFEYFGIDLTSIYYPMDWRGVAKIIQWFLKWPLSLSLPIIISCLTYLLKAIIASLVNEFKTKK